MRQGRLAAGIVVALSAFAVPAAAQAAEGDLDPSFGTGTGRVTTTVGMSTEENDMAIDGQGRIVVVGGVFRSTDRDVAIARYLPNGALDQSFNGDGLAFVDGPANGDDELANDVTVDSRGGILVAGSTIHPGPQDEFLARVNPDGTRDTSFGPAGSDGFIRTDFGADDSGNAVAIDSRGRIVLAGWAFIGGDADFSVLRYDSSGKVDTGFSSDGRTTVDFTSVGGDDDLAQAVAFDPQDRIVLVGSSKTPAGTDVALARLNADGTRDATFGTNTDPSHFGQVTTPIGSGVDRANAVTIDPQGRIVVAGSAQVGAAAQFAIARYNANGSLDNTFSGDGKVITPINALGPDGDQAFFDGVDPQGRIVAAGRADGAAGPEFALARYTSNGALDPAFGGDGKVTAPDGKANAAAFDAQDRIVVEGLSTAGGSAKFGLARFIGDAVPPTATISSGPAAGSFINDPTPTFGLSSSEAGSSFTCGFDDLKAACTSPFTSTTTLGDGAHTFSLVATDRAGNPSAAVTRTFNVDTHKPELKVKGKGKVKTRGRKAKDKLKIKANEPATFRCKVDKKKAKPCKAKYKTPKLKLGKHKIKVTATDRAGNKASKTKRLKVVRKR